ncbi:hypothetical protein ACWCYL_29885 [Streptomyces sp. 900105755]|uniref:hypothetical protein n=1 Tax=Streptomyces sp. 900105755 TaxID=3154389 RepID=UPI00333316EE
MTSLLGDGISRALVRFTDRVAYLRPVPSERSIKDQPHLLHMIRPAFVIVE